MLVGVSVLHVVGEYYFKLIIAQWTMELVVIAVIKLELANEHLKNNIYILQLISFYMHMLCLDTCIFRVKSLTAPSVRLTVPYLEFSYMYM